MVNDDTERQRPVFTTSWISIRVTETYFTPTHFRNMWRRRAIQLRLLSLNGVTFKTPAGMID
jgi:hypothetical protein